MLRRLLVALLLTGITAAGTTAQPLSPLVVGWEQYFKVQWEPVDRAGVPLVRGYVLNDWGVPAARVQLLVDRLDAQGAIVGQKVAWLGTPVLAPGVRSYFEVPVEQTAAGYRVSVFAFEWMQVGGDRD
jgi:hypothetical protein